MQKIAKPFIRILRIYRRPNLIASVPGGKPRRRRIRVSASLGALCSDGTAGLDRGRPARAPEPREGRRDDGVVMGNNQHATLGGELFQVSTKRSPPGLVKADLRLIEEDKFGIIEENSG